MSIKVNLLVKSCLRNEKKEYNIKGIYQDDKIKFKETNTLMVIDLKNNIIDRIKDKEIIKLDFINNNCNIISNNLTFNIPIKVLEIEVLKNNFKVSYEIENNSFKFEIKII